MLRGGLRRPNANAILAPNLCPALASSRRRWNSSTTALSSRCGANALAHIAGKNVGGNGETQGNILSRDMHSKRCKLGVPPSLHLLQQGFRTPIPQHALHALCNVLAARACSLAPGHPKLLPSFSAGDYSSGRVFFQTRHARQCLCCWGTKLVPTSFEHCRKATQCILRRRCPCHDSAENGHASLFESLAGQ